MISVVIATRNRPKKLYQCLDSLQKNTFPKNKYEIIIVDQSDHPFKTFAPQYNTQQLRYFYLSCVGKSKALNFAIDKSQFDLLAFTDDDCLTDSLWLTSIEETYLSHSQIAGIFGRTIPHMPHIHKGKICPATFETSQTTFINEPQPTHYKVLGQGNNMSLRKSILNQVGIFNPGLGVGSFSRGGEDSDMIFRILKRGHTLMVNPKMIIFHNRWLTPEQEHLQQAYYSRGLAAFYGLHFFSNTSTISPQIKDRVQERLLKPLLQQKKLLSQGIIHPRIIVIKVSLISLELLNLVIGILIGIYLYVSHLPNSKKTKPTSP